MLEWAREVMHRLLQDQDTSVEGRKRPDESAHDGQGRTTGGFDRFLQEFEANNDETVNPHPDGKRAA